MALDTSGHWDSGDDLRIIEALLLPFGTYVLDCTQNCMNQLEDMSPEAVLRVKALLDEYDAVSEIEYEQNSGDVEGKVLVKADVLEWEVVGATNGQTGPEKQLAKVRYEIANYFAFCSCLGGYLPGNGLPGTGGGYPGRSGTCRLYRS